MKGKNLFLILMIFLFFLLTTGCKESDKNHVHIENEFFNPPIVKIEGQTWMKVNLHPSFYSSQPVITGVPYAYNEESDPSLGNLYTYEQALSACPPGWHLPTVEEWMTLINVFGGIEKAGGYLKSPEYWQKRNTTIINPSGFSALPAGGGNGQGKFDGMGWACHFWCSGKAGNKSGKESIITLLDNADKISISTISKSMLASVRYIKNPEPLVQMFPQTLWSVKNPYELGINETAFYTAIKTYSEICSDPHDILIIKDGAIVFDQTFYPYLSGTPHALMSCTKSVLSVLTGIAIDKKMIGGVNTPLYKWFPELKEDGEKKKLTLFNLLTMTMGLDWQENGSYNSTGAYTDSYLEMISQNDPVKYFFGRKQKYKPGDRFTYNSGASVILGIILEKSCGMSLLDFANKYLFEEINIHPYTWMQISTGNCNGASGLYLEPKDMARFGLLVASGGKWGGKQIVSKKWINRMVSKWVDTPPGVSGNQGYGFLWWMNSCKGFSARGFGGQYILVYPGENLVIITTGGLFKGDHLYADTVLGNGVLNSLGKAVKDDSAKKDCLFVFTKEQYLKKKTPFFDFTEKCTGLIGKRMRFEDGSTIRLGESDKKGYFNLQWMVNGKKIDTLLPKNGDYTEINLGNFGSFPENKAFIALSRLDSDFFEFILRRYGIPYIYQYRITRENSDLWWNGFVNYMNSPFETYKGVFVP